MIEGKLAEDWEPRNVQVNVVGSEGGLTIRLRDASGMFLEIRPTGWEDRDDGQAAAEAGMLEGDVLMREDVDSRELPEPRPALESELESVRNRVLELESVLEVVTLQNSQLKEELRILQEKLREERAKYNVLWRMNCEQLTEYDVR